MEDRKSNSKRKQVIVDHNLDGPSHVICLPASLSVSQQHLLYSQLHDFGLLHEFSFSTLRHSNTEVGGSNPALGMGVVDKILSYFLFFEVKCL
jgi:hypothetical protein